MLLACAAQYNCGVAFATGDGVEPDERVAVEWSEKTRAVFTLVVPLCLFVAVGAKGRTSELPCLQRFFVLLACSVVVPLVARSRYRKAAEQGYASAQLVLGWRTGAGDGVQRDETKAIEWCVNLNIKFALWQRVSLCSLCCALAVCVLCWPVEIPELRCSDSERSFVSSLQVSQGCR